MKPAFLAALLLWVSASANAVSLVQTLDPGFYNHDIGNLLDNTNGGNTPAGYFPTSDDSTTSFPIPPDLSTVNSVLGNWLTDPLHLNSHWSATPISIPNSWPVSTEVAIIYQFDTLGATNVVAQFGVDNGMFAWLDGNYLFGARAGGSHSLGEYQLNLGSFSAGTHFLQLLLEDHGGSNGYDVSITATTFIPGPPPVINPVPEPSTYAMLLAGLGLLGFIARRRSIQSVSSD